jgi:hypothetical protein
MRENLITKLENLKPEHKNLANQELKHSEGFGCYTSVYKGAR